MNRISFLFFVLACSAGISTYNASAGIINIPNDYSTIQAGIDAASDADTVLVQPGTYVENINFNGKNIVVGSLFITTQDTSYISKTVIDGNKNGSVVTFINQEDSSAVLCGLTITKGSGTPSEPYVGIQGGGILCRNSSPTLIHVTVIGNEADHGCGIYTFNSKMQINHTKIIGNRQEDLEGSGGGILFAQSDIYFNDVIIANNKASLGGGIRCVKSHPIYNNVLICENIAWTYGGGGVIKDSSVLMKNVKIYGNIGQSSAGVGLYNSTLVFEKSIISDNETDRDGGGINCSKSTLYLINSIIAYNKGLLDSGGIYTRESKI